MTTLVERFTLDGHVHIEDVVVQMENLLGVTLMSRSPTDTLHGYVNSAHLEVQGVLKTEVEVHLYQEEEPPTSRHSSIGALAESLMAGLPEKEKKQAWDKMIPVLGGHTTRFKRASGISEKRKKIIEWKKGASK